ncbi:hypothetical protein BGX28_008514 [Mortierella sp. GBA30]|nr:hypothetical protein BGX28_008514 [Mortierella sp. GBA30]
MEQDNAGMDYLKVDHPQSTSSDSILKDSKPTLRERSGSDSPKSSTESKTHSYGHSEYMTPRLKSLLFKYYSRSAEFLHIEANTLHRRVDYVTDGLNVALTQLAKIVLIEDNKRSLKFIGVFYTTWTLRTWFSTTTLLSLILISLFAAPRIYLDNQELIDARLTKTNDVVQGHVGKVRHTVQEQWTSVYSKAEKFAHEKGILKTDKSD